jgi:TRAP-type C4-dicarboxylate transport system substrate-binding protein
MREATKHVLSCVAAGVLLSISPAGAAEFEWSYFTYFPTNDKPAQTTRAFAEEVGKATGGRLKITVYASGELPYKATDVVKAVASNQVQMGDTFVGFAAGDLPALNVLGLPFLCTSFDQFQKAVAAAQPAFDKALNEKFGVQVAVHWTMPPQNLWLARPVQSTLNLNGLKIRTTNPEQVAMVRSFGGAPVSINSAEVVSSLERKIIDGALTSALSINDWRAYEMLKAGYLVNYTMGHQMMLVNSEQLRKLPEDVRSALLSKAREWQDKYMEAVKTGEEVAKKNLTANGMQLHEISQDERAKGRDLLRPMWEEWASKNGELGKELLSKASAACAS